MPETLRQAMDALAMHHPTWRHAVLLFDALVEHLGPLAVLDSAEKGTQRWLYRRVAEGSPDIVPWCVARIQAVPLHQGILDLSDDDAADWWKQTAALEETKAPRLRGLRSGWMAVHDGQQKLELRYGENGVLAERCIDDRFPGRLGELVSVLAGKGLPGYERAAAFVASLDHDRHSPARVRMPLPMPGGVGYLWCVGRSGVRRALLDGHLPSSARFVISDAVAGTATGWGATLEEAQAAFDAEVRRAMPRPDHTLQCITDDYDDDGNLIAKGEPLFPLDAQPDADSEPPSPPEVDPVTGRVDFGHMVFRGPTSDVPTPDLTPATLPSVVVPLDPVPDAPPPFGRWIRTLGEIGATRLAARFKADDGYILVGEKALRHVERGRLLEQLQEADEREKFSGGDHDTPYEAFMRYEDTLYLWEPADDEGDGRFRRSESQRGNRFDAASVDGDRLLDRVRRHVKIRRGSRS